ncbi:phosphoethanolamine--lipid A transferase [Vibrio metschnikovii]|uniref:phosphoethanolamine transferase n=1 Tax=Vibrio metschnikovii TaxID=28172 RepID=UPI002FCB0DEE
MNNIKSLLKKQISYHTFTLFIALYFATIINLPVYKSLFTIINNLESVKIGFIISIPLFFLAVLNFLFQLFSWPWLSKPFFIILLLLSSLVSYAGYNYGTIFDTTMIANIIETDSSEAGSYLSGYSILWTLIIGVIPAIIIAKIRLTLGGSFFNLIIKKLISLLVSLCIISLIAVFYYQDYVSVGRNNSYLNKIIIPTHFIYSTVKYLNNNYFITPLPYREIGQDAQQSAQAIKNAETKPTLVVFIMGETARSQNYQLNGYPRKTNAYTDELPIISFQDVSSCGTATAVSVPCLFSSMTRSNFDRQKADNQDNALDILKRAGISLLWKENDGGDKEVAKNIDIITIDRTENNELCNGKTCYDMALLENFEQDVENMQGNRLIALHLIGSHGPTYFQRYPEDKAAFMPDCPRADIENCSVEQIVNSYDNTILYTDYVLRQTIDKLKALEKSYHTALIYVSDHGESLGENGIFLHGMPYRLAPEYQTKVPLMVWMSPSFQQIKNINYDCLQESANKIGMYSHDNIFHSLLGIMDVNTEVYQPELDIFESCRTSL